MEHGLYISFVRSGTNMYNGVLARIFLQILNLHEQIMNACFFIINRSVKARDMPKFKNINLKRHPAQLI